MLKHRKRLKDLARKDLTKCVKHAVYPRDSGAMWFALSYGGLMVRRGCVLSHECRPQKATTQLSPIPRNLALRTAHCQSLSPPALPRPCIAYVQTALINSVPF